MDNGMHELLMTTYKKWFSTLVGPLSQLIIRYFHHLFEISNNKCIRRGRPDKVSVYTEFQSYCMSVKDIPFEEVESETKKLEESVPNLQNVIKMIMRDTFRIMSVSRTNGIKAINLPPIDKRDFIKKCYQECASQIACRFPHYFDTVFEDKLERFKKFAELKAAVEEEIDGTIIGFLPTETISAPKHKTYNPIIKPYKPPKARKDILLKKEKIYHR